MAISQPIDGPVPGYTSPAEERFDSPHVGLDTPTYDD
jgi:hypothetical protein